MIRDAAALTCAHDILRVIKPDAEELTVQLVAMTIQSAVARDEINQSVRVNPASPLRSVK